MKSLLVAVFLLNAAAVGAQPLNEKSISTIERAMQDELVRAKEQLKVKGLIDPFFIQYTVSDQRKLDISASNGALTNSSENRTRQENVRLLVGDYKLNDENFDAGGGGFFSFNSSPDNTLPLDDDYAGIRRALWLSTDDLFKDANETFTKKKAALEHKQLDEDVKDLPDFARAQPAVVLEPVVGLKYDRKQLEELVRDISTVFAAYKNIQSSGVSLSVQDAFEMIQNTEGTRTRKPVTLVEIKVSASAQAAADGDPLSLQFSTIAAKPEALPSRTALIKRAQDLAEKLEALRNAPRFGDKEYTGPVLFEGDAGRDFLAENLVSRLSAKREDVLGDNGVSSLFGSAKKASLKEKLNTRVLPTSMSVIDRPTEKVRGSQELLGAYNVDDEGVAPTSPLVMIDKGILKTLYMNRTPTKEVREPNGHARSLAFQLPGTGEAVAAPGVVEIIDSKAKRADELKKELLNRAKDNGYDYALIVRSIQTGIPESDNANFSISDLLAGGKFIVPQLLYKVNVKTGKEELVRAAEIAPPTTRDLRELITSKETEVRDVLVPSAAGGMFNFSSRTPATMIGPRDVLCSELEVHRKKAGANPTQPVVSRP